MGVLGMNDIALFYQETEKNPIDTKEFRRIVNGFHQFLADKIIAGETVRLPERLGEIKIVGRKVTPKIDPETGNVIGLAPDWGETRKLWEKCPQCEEEKQLVYHLNEHTNGIRYKVVWSKIGVFLHNRDFYAFTAVRSLKRTLKKAIDEGKEYFIGN